MRALLCPALLCSLTKQLCLCSFKPLCISFLFFSLSVSHSRSLKQTVKMAESLPKVDSEMEKSIKMLNAGDKDPNTEFKESKPLPISAAYKAKICRIFERDNKSLHKLFGGGKRMFSFFSPTYTSNVTCRNLNIYVYSHSLMSPLRLN